MSTTDDIFNVIVTVLKPYVKDDDAFANVNMETDIVEDLRVNSARLVDVILAIEDSFGVEISDDDVDDVFTVGDAVKLISNFVR